MNRILAALLLCAPVALASSGPASGPSARAQATPTVRTFGAGVVLEGLVNGLLVGRRGDERLAWTWRGQAWATVPPPAAPAASTPPSDSPVVCAAGTTAAALPAAPAGWTLGLCPDGRVAIRHELAGHATQAVVVVRDGAPTVGARALDPGGGAVALVAWGADGSVRASAWRGDELVPVAWVDAWMPAGPPLAWPVPAAAREDLQPAVTLDLTLPAGAVIHDAAIVDGRLWLVGTLGAGRAASAALFDTPWIPVLPR